MPDPNNTSVAEPSTTTAVPADAVTAVPETPVAGNPDAEAARRALYEKHYGGPPPADAPPNPVLPTEVVTDPAPPSGGISPEMWNQAVQTLQSMQAEIASLKQPPPQAAAPADAEPSWVKHLREGNIAAAEDALASAVAQKNSKGLIEQAVAQATTKLRLESEAASFVNEVKAANPDLVPLEMMIAADAQNRLVGVTSSGKIQTPEDAIREYKKAVLDATESARKLVQSIRGSGKAEAMVRNREVLSASTMSPQQVEVRTGQAEQATEDVGNLSQEQLTQRYLNSRRTKENANRGLAV